MDYTFLLVIAVILLFTKAMRILSRNIDMPQVVGSLLAGLILGPSILGVIPESDYIAQISEIGCIMLMFIAGLETDLTEIKKDGLASVVIAAIGVIIPLIMGSGLYYLWFGTADPKDILKGIFIGIVLTATSVSITVEALKEMGKLKGKIGTTILGAAVIDDILGIINLSLITNANSHGADFDYFYMKITAFFIFLVILAFVIKKERDILEHYNNTRTASVTSLCFCFILAYISEVYFGITDITGAYFAGVLLCNLRIKDYVSQRTNITAYMIFAPIFFASIGIDTNLRSLTPSLFIFALLLLAVAVVSKLLGCGFGAKLMKYSNTESLTIGFGMISRGEVSLIIAQKGEEMGLIDVTLFPAIIFVVIVTTLITPILLKTVITKTDKEKDSGENYNYNI
ncbi:MAG: cation:proton antiporter [Clostridiales bacterium]|nr:cation:proton antiporter [Clostridiales bacterium]